MDALNRLIDRETAPEALAESCAYLAENMRLFLQTNEDVLICYPDQGPDSLGGLFSRAVKDCGCVPVHWGPDFCWKTLLRQAFSMRITAIIGPPLVVLGLTKIAKTTETPLFICNAVLCGYPYVGWMVEGIKSGLDCNIWGCYVVANRPVVAGFSCGNQSGIHIREGCFRPYILDENGYLMGDSLRGHLMLDYRKEPGLVYDTNESARLLHQPCSCGRDDARIMETRYIGGMDPEKEILEDRFLAWSSILDYRVHRSESGLELELVVFPGQPLPKIPECSKLIKRPWNPDRDQPFCMDFFRKVPEKVL